MVPWEDTCCKLTIYKLNWSEIKKSKKVQTLELLVVKLFGWCLTLHSWNKMPLIVKKCNSGQVQSSRESWHLISTTLNKWFAIPLDHSTLVHLKNSLLSLRMLQQLMEHLRLLHISTSISDWSNRILWYQGLRLQVHVPMHAGIVPMRWEGWRWSHVAHIFWCHGPDHVRVWKKNGENVLHQSSAFRAQYYFCDSTSFFFSFFQFFPTSDKNFLFIYYVTMNECPSDNITLLKYYIIAFSNTSVRPSRITLMLLFSFFDFWNEPDEC